LPLADHVRDTLAKWHAQTGGRPDDYVFSSPKTGDRFDNFKKRWRTVFNRAGIEGVTPHSLRHTFCSRLIQAGADLESVRRLAGHSSIAVTAIYLHGDAQTDRNAMALLKPPTDGGDNIVAFPGAVNASED
jgi:integrase